MDLSDTKAGSRGWEGSFFKWRKVNSCFHLHSSFFSTLTLVESADSSKIDSWRVGWTILTHDLINSHSQVSVSEPQPSWYFDSQLNIFCKWSCIYQTSANFLKVAYYVLMNSDEVCGNIRKWLHEQIRDVALSSQNMFFAYKQYRSWSAGFWRSRLIRIYTVCQSGCEYTAIHG